MKIIRKILFCIHITADISSFFRLVVNSKKLSRSKSRTIPSRKINESFPVNIKFKGLAQTIFLRTYKGDIDIFFEIFHKGIYAVPTSIKDVKLIFDLGANIGLSAIFFSAIFPRAVIICVEPGEENYQMLLKNLEDLLIKQKVKVINAAVIGQDGKVSFEDGKMHYNGKVFDGDLNNTIALSMPTLFENYNVENVGLMKIDVEGSEKEIFKANLHWLSAVQNIVIEMHSDEIRDDCLAVFKQNNFSINQITTDPTNKNLFWVNKR